MKRILLAAALGVTGFFAGTTAAQAQRTDSTTVKPQLPTGPPMAPPPTPVPPRPTQQPAPPAQQPTTPPPARPGGIDDDGRTAQPLPGSRPAPAQPQVPGRPGGGIDDDGRPAQVLPPNGTVPGATLQKEYVPGKLFVYGSLLRFGLSSNYFNGVEFSAGFAPALGYRITDRFSVAAGPVLVYHSANFGPDADVLGLPTTGYQFTDLGLRGLAQFTVYKNIFLHVEYESTRSGGYVVNELVPNQQYEAYSRKFNTSALLLGGGYRQRLGDRFAVEGTFLYNTDVNSNYYGILLQRLSLVYNLGGK